MQPVCTSGHVLEKVLVESHDSSDERQSAGKQGSIGLRESWVIRWAGDEKGRTWTPTNPLNSSHDLFREFASLDPAARDGFRRFADAHGLLGIGRGCTGSDGRLHLEAELADDWRAAVMHLRRAVGMWERWASGDASELRRYLSPITLTEGARAGSVMWYYAHPDSPRRSEPVEQPHFMQFNENDVMTPAILLVSQWVGKAFASHVHASLPYDIPSKRPVLRFQPHGLLGALWFQLGAAISSGDTIRQCANSICRKLIRIAAASDKKKDRRRFCDTKCKMQDYRERKLRAIAYRRDGWSSKRIADETGTDVKTVREWVRRVQPTPKGN